MKTYTILISAICLPAGLDSERRLLGPSSLLLNRRSLVAVELGVGASVNAWGVSGAQTSVPESCHFVAPTFEDLHVFHSTLLQNTAQGTGLSRLANEQGVPIFLKNQSGLISRVPSPKSIPQRLRCHTLFRCLRYSEYAVLSRDNNPLPPLPLLPPCFMFACEWPNTACAWDCALPNSSNT